MDGSYFGDIEIFERIQRNSTAVATNEVNLLVISKHDFDKLLKGENMIRDEMERIANERRILHDTMMKELMLKNEDKIIDI